jgi:acetone carboxylase gamma subunit
MERVKTHHEKSALTATSVNKVRRIKGPEQARITDSLSLKRLSTRAHLCCSQCDTDLGPAQENYKLHCLMEENPITEANPNIGDYHRYIDERPVWRQFYCPGCGTLIENEVARSQDPVLADIELQWPEALDRLSGTA